MMWVLVRKWVVILSDISGGMMVLGSCVVRCLLCVCFFWLFYGRIVMMFWVVRVLLRFS